jgi:acyl-homoserine lactone acylase PvdQ
MLTARRLALLALLCSSTGVVGGGGCGGGKGGGSGEESGDGTVGDTGDPLGDPELFPGLRGEVEILIDDRGIPHIYAHNGLRPVLRRGLPDGDRPDLSRWI